VLLNFSGRTTVMDWEVENIPTILNVWFGGSEAADAICDVVFGDVSPSGKLTATMPRNVGQIPIYYNHLMTGRPNPKWFSKYTSNYLDVPNDPLFPFGYGLSYTTFEYSPMTLSSNTLTQGGNITASVTVTNTGSRAGAEVVQLYIRDMVGSIARPVQELKGFERINLKPGESRTVTFTINADLLKFYNKDLEHVCEPGDFEVMIGTDSRNVQRLPFTLTR
jgi:beta-glucosidase